MVTSLQVISKILATHSYSLVEDNGLTSEYFPGYEKELEFIDSHIKNYGNVPDTTTFLATFPDIELVEVTESDTYLLDKLREEHLFNQSSVVIQEYAKLLQTDSNAATEYMAKQLKVLEPNYHLGGIDIVGNADKRFEQFKERKERPENFFFESGFKELDDIIKGIQRDEELFVIYARTNQGKSWVIAKICSHIWQTGFNVGYYSPEMTANRIGFRFDTLTSHYKNKALLWGSNDINEDDYKNYIDNLKTKNNKFMVATPSDFGNCCTVSKLKNWIKQNKLDVLAIDGISYIANEHSKRNESREERLTTVSQDLMSLSVEMGIPILVVVQANRKGVAQEDDGTPELDTLHGSDGISHNATKALSIRQKKDNILEIGIKKNRDGAVGGKLNYQWNIDTGDFIWIPSYDDAKPKAETEKNVNNSKKQYAKDNADVF